MERKTEFRQRIPERFLQEYLEVLAGAQAYQVSNLRNWDLMRSYAASDSEVFFKLRLPSSLPYVFSALKVGATASLIGSVVAEFFNSAGGIGKLIGNNIQSGDFALAWCGVVIVIVVGLVLYPLISLAERLAIPWERGQDRF